MNRQLNILAAVGQFPHDDMVLVRAAVIARAHRAKLTIAHVIDDFDGFGTASTEFDMTVIRQQLRIIGRENVDAAIARVELDVPDLDIRIEIGSPYARLIELTRKVNASLVVMRAHQRESIVEKIIGSTADRVIRSAAAPVLVVKSHVTRDYKHVVIAVEIDDVSAASIPRVAELFPLARLNLLHVVWVPPQFDAAMLRAGADQTDIERHRSALVRKARSAMRGFSKKLPQRPLRSTTQVVLGDPAPAVARATRSPGVDLLVLGPVSPGMVRQAIIGSVIRRVQQSVDCDVLILCQIPEPTTEPP